LALFIAAAGAVSLWLRQDANWDLQNYHYYTPWAWAHGRGKSQKSNFRALSNGKYRAPDPFLHVRHKFIIRRVAADARKIELGDNAGTILHLRLLWAMGFDLASIHAATPQSVRKIKADLSKRPSGWLNAAAETATTEVRRDFREWKRYRKGR
jgi:hypothetical protein